MGEEKPDNGPLMTVLNYSGGRQSSCLLWMVLRGEISKPESFAVLNADPGMENSQTYEYNAMMAEKCHEAGIYFETVDGPNLYHDLLSLKDKPKRLDNPPYWTAKPDGKRGQLQQKCTKYYKIAPMDRAMRRLMEEWHGISRKNPRLGENVVRKWIGLSHDEWHRVKPAQQKYVYFEYPLIDMKMTQYDVNEYFSQRGLPIPPRSVCNACFANGLRSLKEMKENRPQDWEQAVAVDEAVRDMSSVGIQNPVYVNDTLIPLRVLGERNFDTGDEADWYEHACDSGYCFT